MKKKLLVLLLTAASFQKLSAQEVAPFKARDRVVFVGNSITDGGHYHSYIWLYYMTRFPNQRITCLNAGIGGDVVEQIYNRFDTDVLSKKPTVLSLTWGMNDTGYFEWYRANAQDTMKTKLERSFHYYHLLEQKLKQRPDIRKIVILGSPYDETTKFTTKNLYPHKAEALGKVVDFQEQAAKANGWPVVDFYHPMLAMDKKGQATDSTFSLTPNDRIHPDNDGHMVMAYLFLKAQGFENKPVALIHVDAKTGKLEKAENCRITGISKTLSGISFDYLAAALPYPVDTEPRGWGNRKSQSEALKLVPFIKEFNQEILRIGGLPQERYDLVIDGEKMGTYTNGELAAGVNMAEISRTPQYQQAVVVMALNEERWDIERRLRNYAWMEYDFLKDKGMLFKDNYAAMDSVNKYAPKNPFINGNKDTYTRARFATVRNAWQKEQDLLTDEIYTINKPKQHKITLVAVK